MFGFKILLARAVKALERIADAQEEIVRLMTPSIEGIKIVPGPPTAQKSQTQKGGDHEYMAWNLKTTF
jgi:hypothetical protein